VKFISTLADFMSRLSGFASAITGYLAHRGA
jgi:hypothetical protein